MGADDLSPSDPGYAVVVPRYARGRRLPPAPADSDPVKVCADIGGPPFLLTGAKVLTSEVR